MNEKEIMVATVPEIAPMEEQQLNQEVTDIEFKAESLLIETDADYEEAGRFGTMLKTKAAEVTDFFKPMKESAYRAHKEICDREKAMLKPLKNAEAAIKRAMSAYYQEKERQRREQEEALRRAVEAERERKVKEAEELEAAGDSDGAEAAMTEAVIMDSATSFSVPAATKPKSDGVSTTKDWEIVSIDPEKVPLAVAGVEIRPVDKSAVMRLIRASKGTIEIPGIAFKEITKMSFRRGK